MEYLGFSALIIALVVIFFIFGLMDEKKARENLRSRLIKQYGTYSAKEYAEGRMKSIRSVLRFDKEANKAFFIDDITWNDLEMDRLFMNFDYTRSAAGEEALYRFLRIPVFGEEILQKREKHIRFFSAYEKERLEYMMFMNGIGRTGKYSVYDYLDYLDALPSQNNLFTIAVDVAILGCTLLGFLFHTGFFIPAVGLLMYHCFVYMGRKREVEPYLTTFSYFLRVLDGVKKLSHMSREFMAEFSEEQEQIKEAVKSLRGFQRGAFLAVDGGNSSGPMDIARVILTYINMIFHLDLLKLYSMLHILKEKKEDLISLLFVVGEIEAYVSIAYMRAALKEYAVPEFVSDKRIYEAENLYHPLITDPVPNSVCQKKGMLLTGSNASGKSTFLKAAAINAILAQTIHTVCAGNYQSSFFRVYSSMALRDSLEQGESYFIVEIKSLKRIFDGAKEGGYPVFCTIDEVLRGTNTAERIGASTELLKALSGMNVLCFAATHDLELTSLLKEEFDNYHFEEMVEGADISFPYLLKEGSAKGRNAIKLLGAMGFDPALVERAEKLAGGIK